MDFINPIVIWIFINTVLPLSPILVKSLIEYISSEKFQCLKWYQLISRNDGFALYSALISISSLSKPILSSLSTPNISNSINEQRQNSYIYLFILLVMIFILSFATYIFLLSNNTGKNGFNDEQERKIANITVFLALAATMGSLFMSFVTENL